MYTIYVIYIINYYFFLKIMVSLSIPNKFDCHHILLSLPVEISNV